MNLVAEGLVLVGAAFLLVAGLGLFVLPDALARQHAATKAATVALGAILLGVAILGGTFAWAWRAAAIAGVLFATLPISSHMLARAAARELMSDEELLLIRPQEESGAES